MAVNKKNEWLKNFLKGIVEGVKATPGYIREKVSGGDYTKMMNERSKKMQNNWESSSQGKAFEEKNKSNSMYRFLKKLRK